MHEISPHLLQVSPKRLHWCTHDSQFIYRDCMQLVAERNLPSRNTRKQKKTTKNVKN